jgi:predicted dehydrogenase
MQKNFRSSRRDFLKTAGMGVAVVSASSFGRFAIASSKSPNEKLNIAIIGTANRASDNIDGVAGENIVALCDVDKTYLDRLGTRFPAARRYADYRELIAKEAGKIDAVVVSTADHHHAPATIRAIRSGLHVYCEKPLAHTIQEARIVAKAAKEKSVATQMGTQIHSGDNYRRVVEIVQSGAIGDVTDVHVWVGKGWGGTGRPKGDDKPPESLSWDLWLGPAPVRPFVSGA